MSTRNNATFPNFNPEAVPSFAGRRPSGLNLYRRCDICRCYILQEGDFCLCLGCVTDSSYAIQRRLKVKLATVFPKTPDCVTLNETGYMLSEARPTPFSPSNRLPDALNVIPKGVHHDQTTR